MATVLVIDDNEDERQIYSAVLHYNGFEVREAPTAMVGIEIAKEHKPDLILMDVRMPGLNGLLATEILHAMPETKSIPVVCVTGFDVNPEHAARSGCARLLRKPVSPGELVGAVRGTLEALPRL